MSQEAQAPVEGTIELTEHEQEMVTKVDEVEAKAQGLADPESAPDYVETPDVTPSDTVDYKAKYEELLASKEPTDGSLDIKEEPKIEETPKGTTEEPTSSTLTPEQMGKYNDEFTSSGKLSDESYKELSKSGLSKEIVDTYIQGQSAIREAQATKVYDIVGGANSYGEMITWAKDNWTPEQINVFNNQVNSGNDAQIMFGVEALATQFKAVKGSPLPSRTLKGSSGSKGSPSNSYESKDDMYKAMDNKLYGKDASYTNMVSQKIANSRF
jgi:hypothetical protein